MRVTIRGFSLLLILVAVFCCSNYIGFNQPERTPLEFIEKSRLTLKDNYNKVLFNDTNNTIYLLSKKTNYIDIYRNNNFFQRIGGIGFDKSNFSSLSDIFLDRNGFLYALDNLTKTIKIFDQDGNWRQNVVLDALSSPALFVSDLNNNFIIYDKNLNEIVYYSTDERSIIYQFGKFELNDPKNLALTKNRIFIYDSSKKTTFIYDISGRFIDLEKKYVFSDRFRNNYFLLSNYVAFEDSLKFGFSEKKWTFASVNYNNFVLLLTENEVRIGRMRYD